MNYRLARAFARIAAHIVTALGLVYAVAGMLLYAFGMGWHWIGWGIGLLIGAGVVVATGVIYALLAALHAYLDAMCPPITTSPPAASVSAPPEDPRAQVRAQIAQQRRHQRAIKPSNSPP